MAQDKITLKLDGTVRMEDLQVAVNAVCDLLAALAVNAGVSTDVGWTVADLKAGSATIVSQGMVEATERGDDPVAAVVGEYARVAEKAQRGAIDDEPDPIREPLLRLAAIVNGHVSDVLMGTPDRLWKMSRSLGGAGAGEEIVDRPVSLRTQARSSVRGRIVMGDDRKCLYFTLEEAGTGKNVRCYADPKWKHDIAKYWETGEWVIVEGTYARHRVPVTITDVTAIVPFAHAAVGSWRDAIGCAPRAKGGPKITAAKAVRRVRDA